MGYQDVYEAWKADPERWWLDAAAAIAWDVEPAKALTHRGAPLYACLADGMDNTFWKAFDRRAPERGGEMENIHNSPLP